MKTTGICPKCHGVDVIRVPATGGVNANAISQGLRAMPVTRYVCHTCGFSEEWIESRANLDRLLQKYGYARDDPARLPPQESIQRQLGLS